MAETFLPGTRFDIASFGELVSDPSRVAMLLSLMDGLARPASELAGIAGVTPATASAHLRRLLAGGLVSVEPLGRHRYFKLSAIAVADALEAIALQAPPRPSPLPANPARLALSQARTCYQHLAGRLGVAWLAALERQRLLRIVDGALALAPRGIARIERAGLAAGGWPAGKPCLDWTERRHHLGGPLGSLLTQRMFRARWLARREGGRAVRVTTLGRARLADLGLPEAAFAGS